MTTGLISEIGKSLVLADYLGLRMDILVACGSGPDLAWVIKVGLRFSKFWFLQICSVMGF